MPDTPETTVRPAPPGDAAPLVGLVRRLAGSEHGPPAQVFGAPQHPTTRSFLEKAGKD